MPNLCLLTDLYQLTMLAGYHATGKVDQNSCFDLYFRRLPFAGGYCVAAGLETALQYVETLNFSEQEIGYLRSLSLFREDFLDWLAKFRFSGKISAISEGELVFPGEPLLRIEAPLPQAQLVESALLNIINFQTLVASKAARVCQAVEGGSVLEFGLRRAQGPDGALSASRAAFIGGCDATSNVLAGKTFGIPVKGTHAHSWIMSFASELEAFRSYANLYPDTCTLLVDTYDTLKSGLPNAIIVGQELRAQGHALAGIRLDSGDLAELSIEARKMLDEAGLNSAKIVASNDLDEHSITSLRSAGARIDIWGVGTNLVTCKDEPALGGVYKLVAAGLVGKNLEPRIKISANPIKTTIPGVKQVYRFYDRGGLMCGDLLSLVHSPAPETGVAVANFSSLNHLPNSDIQASAIRELLHPVFEDGKRLAEPEPLLTIRKRTIENLNSLPKPYKYLNDPDVYSVGLAQELSDLRQRLLELG